MLKTTLREFLFWAHVLILLASLLVGLIIPFWAFLLLLFGHRLHMVIFRGCLFSRLQKALDCMPEHETFIQHMMQRFLHRSFHPTHALAIDMILVAGATGIAISRQFVF